MGSYTLKIGSSFENNELLPSSIRGLIIGNSDCGKTHLLFKLLLQDWLDYNRLFIFSKSLYQPSYQLLIEGMKAKLNPCDISLLFQNSSQCPVTKPKEMVERLVEEYNLACPDGSWKSPIEVYAFSDPNAIPRPENINGDYKNLFIFDDCYLEDKNCQQRIKNFYSRGRHSNMQCFYISQDYHHLDRQTIRVNSNLLILFKLPKKDLSHIYDDIVSFNEDDLEPKCDYKTFEKFCKKVWDKKYEFMLIDKHNDDYNMRLRKGFNIGYSEVFKLSLNSKIDETQSEK
jgi:hypothetical protein